MKFCYLLLSIALIPAQVMALNLGPQLGGTIQLNDNDMSWDDVAQTSRTDKSTYTYTMKCLLPETSSEVDESLEGVDQCKSFVIEQKYVLNTPVPKVNMRYIQLRPFTGDDHGGVELSKEDEKIQKTIAKSFNFSADPFQFVEATYVGFCWGGGAEPVWDGGCDVLPNPLMLLTTPVGIAIDVVKLPILLAKFGIVDPISNRSRIKKDLNRVEKVLAYLSDENNQGQTLAIDEKVFNPKNYSEDSEMMGTFKFFFSNIEYIQSH